MEELTYPREYKTCPACGSTRRYGETESNNAIEKGQLPKDAKIPMIASTARIYNPDNMQKLFVLNKRIPVLFSFFDVCVDCGCLYCIAIAMGEGVIEAQAPPAGGKLPPFFGKG